MDRVSFDFLASTTKGYQVLEKFTSMFPMMFFIGFSFYPTRPSPKQNIALLCDLKPLFPHKQRVSGDSKPAGLQSIHLFNQGVVCVYTGSVDCNEGDLPVKKLPDQGLL